MEEVYNYKINAEHARYFYIKYLELFEEFGMYEDVDCILNKKDKKIERIFNYDVNNIIDFISKLLESYDDGEYEEVNLSNLYESYNKFLNTHTAFYLDDVLYDLDNILEATFGCGCEDEDFENE